MKTKTISKFAALLFFAFVLAPTAGFAQVSKVETSVVKDGYVMLDGEMMALKDGKMSPMEKNIKMENGTKVRKNGRVKTADGKRERLQNGHCIDNTGKIENCNANSQYYTCTHHKEVRAAKDGKCPKCGMDLVRKN